MPSRPRNSLPAFGTPNTVQELRNVHGNLIQKRYYGADGKAYKNTDYGHDHTGAGDPHVHDWDWTMSSPRRPPRPLNPGEQP